MPETDEARPLAYQRCEPEAMHGLTPEHACLLSIATSLKRIADAFQGDERNTGILHVLCDLVRHD